MTIGAQALRRRVAPWQRNHFIHKKILRGVTKVASFLPGPIGGAAAAAHRALSGPRSSTAQEVLPTFATPTLTPTQAASIQLRGGIRGREVQVGPSAFPVFRSREFQAGVNGGGLPVAAAQVMGSAPGQVCQRRCGKDALGRRMVVAPDGLCYPKAVARTLGWRPRPKPPITGGEMKRMRRLAGAHRRMKTAVRDLEKVGKGVVRRCR